MAYYCVDRNAQFNSGHHEVHDRASTKGCLPNPSNRFNLGYHSTCRSAISEAKKYYLKVNGCYHCANECHTT